MDLRSALSPALGGSPALTLAPDFILEAPELCSGQLGQPPDDLLYHPRPSLLVYADTIIIHVGAGRSDPPPLDIPARWRVKASSSTHPHLKRASSEKYGRV